MHARQTKTIGLTTEMAAFVTFTVGIAVIKGFIILSVAVTILMTLILSMKPKLHNWIKTIEPKELYSGIIFLIISAILLPLLPDRGFGPWKVLNPFELWGMVVLIAGISYAGYFSLKYLGSQKGILFTSFTGSIVSSLAVTVTLAKYTKKTKSTNLLITGILIAICTALIRVLLLTLIFNPGLFKTVVISISAMILVALIAAIWNWNYSEHTEKRGEFDLRNPLQLSTAIQFGLVLALVMLMAEASKQWFGDLGVYGLSLISGMADIDSITLSLLQMGGEDLSKAVAANGIILASITNTLVKGVIFTFFLGIKDARKLLILCAMITISGIPGLLFF